MARIRSVKPELWTDSKVVGLSPLARLLWMGSWNFADDYGCMPADPTQLKLRVLPAEPCDAETLVDELLKANVLEQLKSASGETFWHVTNWDRHQKIDKRATPMFGEPESWIPAESPPFPPTSPESPRIPPTNGPGWEGRGKDRKGVAPAKRTREVVGEHQINADGIWAALEDLFGKASTRTERSLRGKLTKSLIEAGATYTSVKERSAVWSKLFPGRNGSPAPTLTDTALEKWWGALGLLVATEELRVAPCSVCDSRRIVGISEDGEVVRVDDPRAVANDRCVCVA